MIEQDTIRLLRECDAGVQMGIESLDDVRNQVRELMTNYGRIDILHLKDVGHTKEGDFITEIGNGNINYDEVIAVANEIGIKHYIVEQDTCPGDPMDSMKISADYLKTLVK